MTKKTIGQIQKELTAPLKSSELQLRVGRKANGGAFLLVYKDARADVRRLNEVCGVFGWKREHVFLDGKNYCTVSLKNPDTGEWVSKQDCGTESNTEAEKGQSSDAFKRACFQFGIGLELYDMPKIYVRLDTQYPDFSNWSMSLIYDKVGHFLVGMKILNDKNVEVFKWVDKERFNKDSYYVL